MATQRRILQELDQNVRRSLNLSSAQRNQIFVIVVGGVAAKDVAHAYCRTDHCIQKICQKYRQTGSTNDLPRSGQPTIISKQQRKNVYKKVCTASKMEYLQLAQEAIFVNAEGTPSKPPSRSTLYRALKRCGLTNYKAKRRPKFKRKHDLLRLKFAKSTDTLYGVAAHLSAQTNALFKTVLVATRSGASSFAG
jgi:transposase